MAVDGEMRPAGVVINETIPIQINTLWQPRSTDAKSRGWDGNECSQIEELLPQKWQQWPIAQYVKMAYYLVNDFRQLTIDRLVRLIPIHHK